ncbi:MAG: T9SS type A sorting domain-containing protein [Bacteroidetes bacterium]|nr:T9SS type A sorting domain-containing protein [Bacteroidota bacterium]
MNATPGTNMNYQWYRNNILIVGANQVNYTVTQQGTYKVSISNSLGCSKTSSGIKIFGPPSVAVSVVGPLEICPPDSLRLLAPASLTNTYQWKLNGVNILGAIGNEFYAKTAGSYKVKVTDVFGCSKTSIAKNVIVNCPLVAESNEKYKMADGEFQIFPNPAAETIFISGQSDNISIYDINGKLVKVFINIDSVNLIDISGIDAGIYFISSGGRLISWW